MRYLITSGRDRVHSFYRFTVDADAQATIEHLTDLQESGSRVRFMVLDATDLTTEEREMLGEVRQTPDLFRVVGHKIELRPKAEARIVEGSPLVGDTFVVGIEYEGEAPETHRLEVNGAVIEHDAPYFAFTESREVTRVFRPISEKFYGVKTVVDVLKSP